MKKWHEIQLFDCKSTVFLYFITRSLKNIQRRIYYQLFEPKVGGHNTRREILFSKIRNQSRELYTRVRSYTRDFTEVIL